MKILNGIFIPSHVNRRHSGILHQLGFVPDQLDVDALEIFAPESVEKTLSLFPELAGFSLIKNSDAHTIELIGSSFSDFFMEEISFEEIRKALRKIDGRKVVFH